MGVGIVTGGVALLEWRGEKGREGKGVNPEEMRVDTQARSEIDRSSNDVCTALQPPLV